MSLTVDPTTNRLTNTGSPAFVYDANGNMTSGPSLAGVTYDFLKRVTWVAQPAATVGYFGYDASNRRIYKVMWQQGVGYGTEAYYLYGLDGENLGTYTPTYVASPASFTLTLAQARVYFFGKKLFVTEDNVGSAASGGTFYPFGEQKSGTTMTEQYAFATYWRDGESGLDYAMNRYYSSGLGRFLSPDPYPGSVNQTNPASFNRYAYVVGDPINGNDPTGLCWAATPMTGPVGGCGIGDIVGNTGSWTDSTGTAPGYAIDNTFDSYTAPPTNGLSQQGTINQFDQGALDENEYINGYGVGIPTAGELPLYGQSNPNYQAIQNLLSAMNDITMLGSLTGAFGGADNNNANETWLPPVSLVFGILTLPFAPDPNFTCQEGGYHPDPITGGGCVPNPRPPTPPRAPPRRVLPPPLRPLRIALQSPSGDGVVRLGLQLSSRRLDDRVVF